MPITRPTATHARLVAGGLVAWGKLVHQPAELVVKLSFNSRQFAGWRVLWVKTWHEYLPREKIEGPGNGLDLFELWAVLSVQDAPHCPLVDAALLAQSGLRAQFFRSGH